MPEPNSANESTLLGISDITAENNLISTSREETEKTTQQFLAFSSQHFSYSLKTKTPPRWKEAPLTGENKCNATCLQLGFVITLFSLDNTAGQAFIFLSS